MSFVKFFIIFLLVTMPMVTQATFDVRVGGGLGFGAGDNGELPTMDGGQQESFSSSGYNVDLVLSEYWLVLGVRAEQHGSYTGDFFYFDQTDNQYTKYGVKTSHQTYSGIIGFHYEINTEQFNPQGPSALYSANLFFVLPFDKRNHVDVESNNALGLERFSGSAHKEEFYALYIEGNRSIRGYLTTGMQIGFRYHTLSEIQDSDGQILSNPQGDPMRLNLSSVDVRFFIGVRF